MKIKITLSIILLVFAVYSGQAQVFWSDSFEDVGAPSSGIRTPENNTGTGTPFTSYFARTNNAGINVVTSINGGYLSGEGSKFWAGENHDEISGAIVAGSEEQEIVWSSINISGKNNLHFNGLFAANNTTAAFENTAFGSTHNDYIIVEYNIDGGAYLPLLRFYANNGVNSGTNNKSLALDTNGDNIGDATILNSTFQNFEKAIPGTGSVLTLRIRSFMNGGSEEWAIDNFKLQEGPACVNPIVYNVTGGGTGSSVTVGLSNSEIGVTYQLVNGTNNVGMPVAGTGAAISFGVQTTSGTYTVVGSRNIGLCTSTMNGNAVVNYVPEPTPSFWNDTFEDVGSPSSGIRTAESNSGSGSPFTAYFTRTNNSGISLVSSLSGGYQLGEGSKFWAGENHDDISGAPVAGTEEQQIDWTGINISGKTGLVFKGLFAANNTSAAFETQALGDTHSDYIIVEYRIDGGSYMPLLSFYGNNDIASGTNNRSLALDTDANNIGDGTTLTTSFQQFENSIPGTGTTLDLRIRSNSNSSNEEWAMDNLRLLDATLSNESFVFNKSFVLYPNPNNGAMVNIKSDFDGDFQVINQLGQIVTSFKVSSNIVNSYNFNSLSDGIYFVKGTNESKVITQKMIIKK
ncbi:T9SS type A sorting domain-containing protein [Flavobacterium terrae]|uniref:Por secretion system C-terminal sorting domain-containing protein n=1 Tax=Flavobacterium terrae TaxID=415425 RepID=A0A1M6FKR7_9FLAO|nr:T9SS type A sorting domain-containing protein [Flavobacterium terrae]SHI98311.1 Por secretion system C-terminal sorting domain-containing protein [Flavobacterium terrae]